MPFPWPGGFFLTDPGRTPDPASVIETLPPGVGVIYRHFGEDDRMELASKLRKACTKRGITLLISNDPHLAIAAQADGVHWPEALAHQARSWRTRFAFQTQSVHSPAGMRQAVCDAVLFSVVFPSKSPSAGSAMGPIRFRSLTHTSNKLVYALGGVNGSTAGSVSRGAGLAAIEGFLP